ncbi:MAG: phosphodiester glycosidase family protein [Deltaproteobacteria bacterium]|nr:phosphodiester glycosidase family protein [Deltaproteobacteria bacterium]
MARVRLRMALVVPFVVLAGLAAPALRATECTYPFAAEDLTWREEESGIWYAEVSARGKGKDILPVHAHLLKIELDDTGLTLRSLRPLGRSLRLEQIVDFFRKGGVDVRAAINGDYFSFIESEKDPLGLHVSGGQLLWFPANTTSLMIDETNRAVIGRHAITASVVGPGFSVPLAGVNRKAERDEVVLYSGFYRDDTIPQQGCDGYRLSRDKLEPMVNGSVKTVVEDRFRVVNAARMEPMDLLLVVCGAARKKVTALESGAEVTISSKLSGFDPVVVEAISGGPRILRDRNVVSEAGQEGFSIAQRFYIPQRHPRSAVGVSKDGKTVFMLVAEGRLKRSGGLTAADAACLLQAAGANDAMLFDGGGSVALLGPAGFYNIPHQKRNRTARDLANTLAVIRRKKK